MDRFYVNKILANLNAVMGNDIGEEIRGIAEYWNIDVGIILGMNIIYEARKVILLLASYSYCSNMYIYT